MQALLGHNDVSTTIVHTHVLNRGTLGVKSPADLLVSPSAASSAASPGDGHEPR